MKGIHINGEQRELLWALLQGNTSRAMLALCDGDVQKAANIIAACDFLWQLRSCIASTPASGGGIWLGDDTQKYLLGLLSADGADTLSLEKKALFWKHRSDLALKLGDVQRLDEALVKAALKKDSAS